MYCVSCLSLKMVASAKICSSRYSRSESTRGDVHECSWVFGRAVPGSADFGSSVEIADRVLHSASSASQSSFPAGLPELPEPPCINWLDSIKKLFVSWSGSNEKSASQQRPPGGVALAIAMRQAIYQACGNRPQNRQAIVAIFSCLVALTRPQTRWQG